MNFWVEWARGKDKSKTQSNRIVRNICHKIVNDKTFSGQWAPPMCRDFQMEILKLTLRIAENICDLLIQNAYEHDSIKTNNKINSFRLEIKKVNIRHKVYYVDRMKSTILNCTFILSQIKNYFLI